MEAGKISFPTFCHHAGTLQKNAAVRAGRLAEIDSPAIKPGGALRLDAAYGKGGNTRGFLGADFFVRINEDRFGCLDDELLSAGAGQNDGFEPNVWPKRRTDRHGRFRLGRWLRFIFWGSHSLSGAVKE